MERCLNDSTNRVSHSIASIPSAATRGKRDWWAGSGSAKDTPRIEAYGSVDELNSLIGLATVSCAEDSRLALLAAILRRVQHELFNLGSILATESADVHPHQPRITAAEIAQLEREIDSMNADLPALRSFVLPGERA